MVLTAEESSSNPLLFVLIAVGVVLVLAAIGLAVWLAKRNPAPAQPAAFGGPYGQPMPQPMPQPSMAPGWYPDPQRQARLRWFDGTQWTPSTQN